MKSKLILFILFGFLSSFNLWGQVLNVTLVKKESCSSSSNGSFTITVDNTTTTVGPYAYTIFGVNTSTFKTGSLTLGVPTDIPNLPVDANYIVAVSDGDNAVSNYSSVQSISSVATISGLVSNKTDNSDQTCLTPNGSITISSVTGGSGSYSFAWTSPGFTSSSQNISNLKGGSYTVVVTDLNANCTFTSSPFVLTDPLPSTFTISSPDVFLCNGEDLVIDIHPSIPTNGIQYTLYDGASAVGTTITWPTSQIVIVGGLSPTGLHSNVRVEGKLTGSICTPIFSTNTLAVQVNVPPTSATLTLSGATPICEGQSSSITANITGGAAPYSFTVTGVGPISGYNGSPISVSPVITTTYSFGSVITDNNGCTVAGSGSFQIVVNPKPTAVISGGGPVCASDPLPNVTFTFTGTAPFDFTYTDGVTPVTITGHNSNTFTILNAPVGTYAVTALKDANTCIATNLGTPIPVSVNPLPTASTAGGATVCADALPTIIFTFTGTAPFNFTYTDGTTPVSVTAHNSTTFTIPNAPAGTYSVTALSDANGCVGTSFGTAQPVIVNPLPTATITGGGSVCASDPLPTVTFTFTGTAPFNFTYTDGVTPVTVTGYGSNSFPILNAPAGTYSITALSDANTCTATSFGTPVVVTVNPIPTASVSGGSTVCADALPTITFTFTGTAPFNFTYTDGTTPVSVTAHNSNTFTIPNAPAGTYSVTALTDFNGCIGTSFGTAQTVIVNPLPTATISGGGTVCASGTQPDVTFTFTGTAPFTFTYTDGVTPVTVTGHNSTTFTITAAPVGTYSITALTDANTCIGTSFGTPVNVSNHVLPTASISGGGTVCSGDPLPTVTFTFTGTAPFTFTYTDGATPVTVTGHATTTFSINTAPAGSYSITALSDANCTGTSLGTAVDVIVSPAPGVVISGGGIVCPGSPQPDVTFTFSGTAPFDFTYSDGTNPPVNVVGHPTNVFTITAAAVGTYSITAFNDASICPATSFGTPVVVSNQVLPTASISGGGTVCSGDPLPTVTFTFTGTAPFTFTYTDGATPVTVTGHATTTFAINTAPAGSYSITALSDANCTGTSLGTAVDVIVNPAPGVVISGGGIVCPGSPQPDVTFTFSGTAPFDFTYSDGTNPPVNVVGHPTNVFTITAAAVGTYSITAFNDASICPATSFGTPVVVSNQVLPTASISGGGTVCSGDPLPTVTFTFTGTAPFTFTYTDGATPVTVTGHATTTFAINTAPAGSYSITALSDANCTGTSLGTAVDVIVSQAPTAPSITFDATPICIGSAIIDPVVNAPVGTSTYTWYSDAALTTVLTTGTTPTSAQLGFSSASANVTTVYVTETNATTCESPATTVTLSVSDIPTATLSGNASGCAGQPANLTVTLTGIQPWSIVYTDGTTTFPAINGITSSPYTLSVPGVTATYTLVSVSNSSCGAGTVSGSGSVTATPIPVLASPPLDTWTGYVYTDASAPAPPVSNINFNASKYRGYITETEMAAFGASTYDVTTDIFDLNFGNATPLAGTNICGSYLDDYSIRFEMTKTMAAGGYTFTMRGDDGVRLFIDGTPVALSPAGSFNTHAYTSYTSAVQCLTAGPHDFVIEYFERGGFSRVTFDYSQAPVPTVNAIATTVVCVNQTPAPTLTANSTTSGVTVTGYKWYSDATLLTNVATTAAYTPSASELDLTTVGTTTFYATATYACGEGPATAFVVDVVNSATITPLASPVEVCQSATMLDLTTVVSAAPTGGTFGFTGTGVTGNMFDASQAAGDYPLAVTYASGTCTANGTVTIRIINSASITVPAATTNICQSATSFDLSTLVSATPIGGSFAFTGTGVTGNTFDASQATGNYIIGVTYTAGTCTDTKNFTVNIVNVASITIPAATTNICQSATSFDLTTLVNATPTGGAFTFTGTGVTGSTFDASQAAGNYTIGVTYTAGTCTDSKSFTVNIGSMASLTVPAATTNICQSATSFDLSTLVGATPTGGSFAFTGTGVTGNMFDASQTLGNYTIGVTYTSGTCNDTKSFIVDIVNVASITVPAATTNICQSATSFDLSTLVSATPTGGSFAFTGTGVTGSSFDASQAPGTYTIGVTYSAGTCTDTKSFTVDIVNVASITVPAATTNICQSATSFDLNTLVSATPTGGSFAFTGTGVTGSSFDASQAPGNYTIGVTYAAGTCTDTKSFTVSIGNLASLTVPATTTNICQSATSFDLSTLVSATPTGGSFAFTGTGVTGNTFDASQATGSYTIGVTYTAGTCTDTKNFTVSIGNLASLTVPATTTNICQSATSFDLSTLVIATPTGGSFAFTGTGVTGSMFDASQAAGSYTIGVTYTAGTCTDTKSFTVSIGNLATLTVPATTTNICQSATSFDLSTLVSATPTGGSFAFTGTGVTGSMFDVSQATGNYIIGVTYTSGTCSATSNFTVGIVNTASITVPAAAISVCKTGGTINLAGFVSASPTGGSFAFSGPGVTGTQFDPTSQSGIVTIQVIYTAGTCTDTKTFDLNVVSAATVMASNTIVCPAGGNVDLTSLVTPTPAGGAFTFTGPGVTGNNFNPSAFPGTSQTINYTYNVGGCTAAGSLSVTVKAVGDPSCGSTGTGNCATVVITPVPTPAQCTLSNGAINFTITPAVPLVNNTGVKITITGISTTNSTIARTNFNNPSFPALPIGVYTYSIEYGDVSCLKTGQVTIDQSGTVGTPIATSVVGPMCAGSSTGAVTLDVPGETGNVLEWSLDGVLWNSFTAGNQITGIPAGAAPSHQRVISVRRNSTDPCNAGVTITIQDQFTPITATITPQTAATCNNNDGSVLVAYSGGDATGAGYTFELDGKLFAMPTDKIIRNLSGGNHILKVIDNKLCSITLSGTQFAVASPGLIQFLTVATADPSCIGNGEDGMITVAFPTGANEVAITQDADRSTPVFKDVPVNGVVEYKNLSKGRYYVTVKSKVNGCPNERAIDILGGPSRISFTQEMTCELGAPVLKITDINVAIGAFEFQITKLGDTTPSVVTLSGIPAGGIYYIKGSELPSATGDYEIKLVQLQGACTISSAISRYTNRGSLKVNAANILPSYSDIATGSFTLTNFAGGTTPYYASIRFDSAANPVNEVGFETDMEEVDSDPSTFGYIKRYNKLHAGRYHVTVNEEGGCSVEFDVRVPIDFTFSIGNIPNVFTPNGDGVNDFFFIRNLPADAQLIISNRWGNEVYSSKSYQNDWNGGSAADGIYYYRLKADGEVVTGWIEIQRGK